MSVCLILLATGCQLFHNPSDRKDKSTQPASNSDVGASTNRITILSTNRSPTFNHSGYALLYDLMGDEKDVAKIRFIKRPRPEMTGLLKEISAASKKAHQQLELFGKMDPSLKLKELGLPVGESAAREAISKTKEKALLSSKGKDLEIQLLLTQQEAMNYGAHLARTIAATESIPMRLVFLRQLDSQLTDLERKLVAMLSQNYNFPEQK